MKQLEARVRSWADATSAGNVEEANAAAMEVLFLAAEEALKNPTPSLLLQGEIDELEGKGNWTEAETVRRRILSLKETLENFAALAKAQMDLCMLLRLLGRVDEAAQFAAAAVASARHTDAFPILVMALECEIWCVLEQGHGSKALALACEAVAVIEPGRLYDSMRAKALVLRARCRLANDNPADAESDLAASWELLPEPSANRLLPGHIVTLANWWEIKARLEQRHGRSASAQVAMMRAVEFRRNLDHPHAQHALSRLLNQLGEMLTAAGDLEAAGKALAEAKSIRQGLNLPSDF